MTITPISNIPGTPSVYSCLTPQISVNFSVNLLPSEVVDNVSRIQGPVDVYCWYEGQQCLPLSGARFMKDNIFQPLYQRKPDAKLCLYSLRSWDKRKSISVRIQPSHFIDAINCINRVAVECIDSASFFQFCLTKNEMTNWVEELSKRQWLIDLSQSERKENKKISELFERSSMFDYIKDWDVAEAYSLMQYVEGFYLVKKSVKEALGGQSPINIAFVLPNDEYKYYLDFQQDLEKILIEDFGDCLRGIDINITFQCFKYTDEKKARPYIDKSPAAKKVLPKEVGSLFDYLLPRAGVPSDPILEAKALDGVDG